MSFPHSLSGLSTQLNVLQQKVQVCF